MSIYRIIIGLVFFATSIDGHFVLLQRPGREQYATATSSVKCSIRSAIVTF